MSLTVPTTLFVPRTINARKSPLRFPAAFLLSFLVMQAPGNKIAYGADFFCTSGDVTCLIAAINTANANGEENTINLEPGTYSLTSVDNGTFGLDTANGLPVISGTMIINGESAETTTVERDPAAPPFRIFAIGGTLTINALTVRGGRARTSGGGILNRGRLTIDRSIIDRNSLSLGLGGGIFNTGSLTISDTFLMNNDAIEGGAITNRGTASISRSSIIENRGQGGGGIQNMGTMTIHGSTISYNQSDGGGGVLNRGMMVVENSTIANNFLRPGNFGGAGIDNTSSGDLRIINSTISGNSQAGLLPPHTRGIFNNGVVELENSILALNVDTDCVGPITSVGNNIIGDPTGCIITLQPTDLTGDPRLGTFIDDGTPGNGHFPLLESSPAIDAGNNDVCLSNPVLATDQIGNPRAGVCDIGAIEFQPAVTVLSVAVNIRPNNTTNNINPNSNALIPVAVLSTGTFDASIVDQASVRFGPSQTGAERIGHLRDVDNDGLPDLVLQFRIKDSGIQCGDASVSVIGQTGDGILIQGYDSITTVGCKAKNPKKK